MTPIPVPAVVLDASLWAVLGDSRAMGQATLIAVGAIVVGFIVRRMWPKSMNPTLFGALAAVAMVAALASMGVPTAGVVLWAAIAVAVALLVLAFIFN